MKNDDEVMGAWILDNRPGFPIFGDARTKKRKAPSRATIYHAVVAAPPAAGKTDKAEKTTTAAEKPRRKRRSGEPKPTPARVKNSSNE